LLREFVCFPDAFLQDWPADDLLIVNIPVHND